MVELALKRQLNHNKKRKFHSAEGPCFKRAMSLCEQINRIWYKSGSMLPFARILFQYEHRKTTKKRARMYMSHPEVCWGGSYIKRKLHAKGLRSKVQEHNPNKSTRVIIKHRACQKTLLAFASTYFRLAYNKVLYRTHGI
jgi:hypothetical protein